MPDAQTIADQRELLISYRQTLHHLLRQRALLGGDGYIPPSVAHGIDQSRAEIRRIKAILKNWGIDVEDRPDDEADSGWLQSAAGEGSHHVSAPAPKIDKRQLHLFLDQHFSLGELEMLCLDVEQDLAIQGMTLPVNLEQVAGETKTTKIIGLIGYLERRGLLSYLVNAAQRARPISPK